MRRKRDEKKTRRDDLVLRRGARPSRRPSGRLRASAPLFSHRFLDLAFFLIVDCDFGFQLWTPFGMFCYVFSHYFFKHGYCIDVLHGFSIDLGMDLSLIFHNFCIRASLRCLTSRTLFLNNSIVFCAQNQVFGLSEKHDSLQVAAPKGGDREFGCIQKFGV